MATTKPRITISLEKHAYEVLGRLAKANKQPMSRIVSELLDATLPYMERAVVLVEQAAKLKGGGLSAELKQSLAKGERAAFAQMGESFGKIDLLLEQETERQAEAVAGAQRRGPPTAATPVPSNHGGQVMRRNPTKGRKALAGVVKKAGRRR